MWLIEIYQKTKICYQKTKICDLIIHIYYKNSTVKFQIQH